MPEPLFAPRFDAATADLVPPPPRRVKLRADGSLWAGRLLILPHLLVGLGIVGAVAVQFGAALHSTEVPAQLTSAQVVRSRNAIAYDLCAHYDAPTGPKDECDRVPHELYLQHVDGQGRVVTGPIRAWRKATLGWESVRFTPQADWSGLGYTALFGLVWNLLMLFIVWATWISPARERTLCQTGAVARGRVVGKRVTPGKNPSRRVRYRFTAEDGSTRERETVVPRAPAFDACPEDGPLTILYDPTNPARSLAYELSQWKIEGVEA